MGIQLITENRKARFNFEITERLEVGLVLMGSEVKSLREGRANLKDGYVQFDGREAFLQSVHISPYPHGGYANHQPNRPRKVLMHKRELSRWRGKINERGFTAIPLRLYFDRGYVKCEIALARGKKLHDKRETLRRKDIERETQAAMKRRNWEA